jgi:hypothetical protein
MGCEPLGMGYRISENQMNNRHRRDSNHDEIVESLRQIPGVSVLDLSQIAGGCPDLLVSNHMITGGADKLRTTQGSFPCKSFFRNLIRRLLSVSKANAVSVTKDAKASALRYREK